MDTGPRDLSPLTKPPLEVEDICTLAHLLREELKENSQEDGEVEGEKKDF